MIEVSLVMTLAGIITMTLLSCLCCVCMKISDLRMKSYIIETANRKGIEVDLDKIHPKHSCQSPHSNENCTIFIPEVALVL